MGFFRVCILLCVFLFYLLKAIPVLVWCIFRVCILLYDCLLVLISAILVLVWYIFTVCISLYDCLLVLISAILVVVWHVCDFIGRLFKWLFFTIKNSTSTEKNHDPYEKLRAHTKIESSWILRTNQMNILINDKRKFSYQTVIAKPLSQTNHQTSRINNNYYNDVKSDKDASIATNQRHYVSLIPYQYFSFKQRHSQQPQKSY